MIVCIQYTRNENRKFAETIWGYGDFETYKVLLDYSNPHPQELYPVAVWKIRKFGVFKKWYRFIKSSLIKIFYALVVSAYGARGYQISAEIILLRNGYQHIKDIYWLPEIKQWLAVVMHRLSEVINPGESTAIPVALFDGWKP